MATEKAYRGQTDATSMDEEKDDQRLDSTDSIYVPLHAPEVKLDIQLIESRFDVTAQTSFKCAATCRPQQILDELANHDDAWIMSLPYFQRCHCWGSFLHAYLLFLPCYSI